ncbi:MAG: hypothetical protein DI538_13500 [Azospira oryzae]|nr:MAG: hypothetical protein DI538_13500 [Azospira oryzae]
MLKRVYILITASLISFLASAQEVKVRGTFLTDSAKLGEVIPYSLTARYPQKTDVLFPDSAFSFAPFEFRSKKYFPTVTKDSISYDSVVYYLSSYEIEPTQRLSLPVFIVHPQDCTRAVSPPDSMRIIRSVKALPDSISLRSLHLKMNTAYQKVKWSLNYVVLFIIVGIIVISGVVLWIVFGKQIMKRFAQRKLEKNHLAFIAKFRDATGQLKENTSPVKTEEVVLIWKKYMEGLVGRPFTKYTSKEILKNEANAELGAALRTTDRIVYGGLTEFAESSFDTLRGYAETQYKNKIEEVKNG